MEICAIIFRLQFGIPVGRWLTGPPSSVHAFPRAPSSTPSSDMYYSNWFISLFVCFWYCLIKFWVVGFQRKLKMPWRDALHSKIWKGRKLDHVRFLLSGIGFSLISCFWLCFTYVPVTTDLFNNTAGLGCQYIFRLCVERIHFTNKYISNNISCYFKYINQTSTVLKTNFLWCNASTTEL